MMWSTPSEVLKLLELNTNKSALIENNSFELVKEVAPIIAESISVIFNTSVRLGMFPNDWKSAKVSPILNVLTKKKVTTIVPFQ